MRVYLSDIEDVFVCVQIRPQFMVFKIFVILKPRDGQNELQFGI